MTVFTQAIHTVRPINGPIFDRWVDFYANDVVPAMERNGYDLVGGWKRSSGRLQQDLVLIRFDSLADMEKASASLRTDAKMGKAIGSMMQDMDVVEEITYATSVPYASEERLNKALAEKPDAPRQYLQAVLPVNLGGQPQAYKTIGELVKLTDGGSGMNLVTAYDSMSGLRGVITDIWVMPGGPGMFLDYRRSREGADITAPLREVAPDEEIVFLNPLPYSPLQ